MNTSEVRALLRKRFDAPEWALLEEVAPKTGGGTRYADAVAVNLWKSRGHVLYGFEIKVSRGDWLGELKKPSKVEESVFAYCDGWYVVAPPGIIKEGELPATWGYLEVQSGRLIEKVKPPKLDPKPLDRAFFASLMRRGHENLETISEMKQRQAINEAQQKINERVEERVREQTRELENTKRQIAKWEEATGLKFEKYLGPPSDVIKVAQHLNEIRYRYSVLHGETGFGFLANMADELSRAAEMLRNALAEAGNPAPQSIMETAGPVIEDERSGVEDKKANRVLIAQTFGELRK